eukprot:gene4792-4328_t
MRTVERSVRKVRMHFICTGGVPEGIRVSPWNPRARPPHRFNDDALRCRCCGYITAAGRAGESACFVANTFRLLVKCMAVGI